MPEVLAALLKHLEHVSAEINSAVREGMYVHMGIPRIGLEDLVEVDVVTGEEVSRQTVVTGVELMYTFEPYDPKRVKSIDLRDDFTKKRTPDYQPPGGFVG